MINDVFFKYGPFIRSSYSMPLSIAHQTCNVISNVIYQKPLSHKVLEPAPYPDVISTSYRQRGFQNQHGDPTTHPHRHVWKCHYLVSLEKICFNSWFATNLIDLRYFSTNHQSPQTFISRERPEFTSWGMGSSYNLYKKLQMFDTLEQLYWVNYLIVFVGGVAARFRSIIYRVN